MKSSSLLIWALLILTLKNDEPLNRQRDSKLKIIGGKLKGRYLRLPSSPQLRAGPGLRTSPQLRASPQLRPTLGRLRETAFNWLSNKLLAANCLDLFAGSGVWGCEAISRGARLVYFVEKNQSSLVQLQKNLQALQIPTAKYELFCAPAQDCLPQFDQQFDLIVLDPPYHKKLIIESLVILKQFDLIANNASIYFECAQAEVLEISSWVQEHKNYTLLKSKKTASIGYGLLGYQSDS